MSIAKIEPSQGAGNTSLAKREAALDFEPRSMTELLQLADLLAKSSLVPKALQGRPGDVAVVIMSGADFKMGAMRALRSMSVINGKATMDAAPMIGMVLASGLCRYFRCVEDGSSGTATWETMRSGDPEPTRMSFSMDDANRAGLLAKGGPWVAYPANMLRARAGANLARLVYPDVTSGCYMEDEADELRAERGADGVFSAPPPPAAAKPTATAQPAEVIDAQTGEVTTTAAQPAGDDAAVLAIEAALGECSTTDEVKALAPQLKALKAHHEFGRLKSLYDARYLALKAQP